MTTFLCLGCFKATAVCVSLHVDSERLIYFRFYAKNILERKFIHCSMYTAGSGLHTGPTSFFLFGPRNILYSSVVHVRKNYHDGEENADGCNAEY